MRVLVTGGAGYVGSVVVEELVKAGAQAIVILDDLSSSFSSGFEIIPKLPHALTDGRFVVVGNIADATLVERLILKFELDVVIHMAAFSQVGESVTAPQKYFKNNLVKSLAFLDACRAAGVKRFVFSSSAAVYGHPKELLITEDSPTVPCNPYGATKLAFEQALQAYSHAYGLSAVAFRYFNAAGATETIGEQHEPETHLIPLVLDVAQGIGESVQIFGDQYPTPDGTCLRDYVHVSDLARAHVLGVESLNRSQFWRVYNLGAGGMGHSVKEVIETARRVTGRAIPSKVSLPRYGDPAVLVASPERARCELGWKPERSDLETIIRDAWNWLQARERLLTKPRN